MKLSRVNRSMKTQTETPDQIAVVGAGLIGKRHVEAIQRSDSADIACIVDPDRTASDFAAEHRTKWFSSISGMLAAGAPDGVIIATPNQMHVEHGLDCVAAGLPMLIEKPIADEAPSADRLVMEAETAGIPILVGHHRRHNPIIRAAKQRIDSGAIGDIVAAQAACWLYKPDNYFDVAWRTQPGAGPVFINLIHDIDLLRHLIGEVHSVQAFASSRTRRHEVEDTAAIILKFTNGALATVTVSDTIVAPWSWELTAAENPAYPATGQTCYVIGGTDGSIEIPTGRVWSQAGEKSWWQPIDQAAYDVEDQDPLDLQISHFCDVIAGRAEPLVSGREGLKSLQVIEAIVQSAEACRTVSLAEMD